MEANMLIGAVALIVAAVAGAMLVRQLFFTQPSTDYRALMGKSEEELAHGSSAYDASGRQSGSMAGLTEAERVERLKQEVKKKSKKKVKYTLDERFFQAGMFSDKAKADFQRLKVLAPIVCAVVVGYLAWSFAGFDMGLAGAVMGLLVGVQLPNSILDRRVEARAEDIMFYLPLVIEQIAIGVSSSLDIGPCLQKVVSMADERDTHNVVTELVRIAQFYVKSGASLEEAMTEVGRLSGHNELKHAFMSLAQVAKHGGEITRQLQELADAVAMQRETKIEERIKKLELQATGPVALVFVGFMIILLVGFGLQLQGAF